MKMTMTLSKLFSKRLTLSLLAAAALTTGLSGCFPIVMGGAAVGGALVATDRRTSGTQLEDEGIELRAGNRISENFGDRAHVNITSYNRQVLLTGEVPTAQEQQRIGELVSKVENVRSVVNELAVLGTSTLVQRSNDSYITGKVKATLVDAKDVQANTVKVVTERGVVYLMGRVTQGEATRVSDLTRGVSGVQKVVRVFEILTDQEVQNISTKLPTQ